MPEKPTERLLERISETLTCLRSGALEMVQNHAEELEQIEPDYRSSAQNLLHYLGIRQHDIRALQEDLSGLGLSSLGVIEAHALASLNAVMVIIEQLFGQSLGEVPEPPVSYKTGPMFLRDHTRTLLGADPTGRNVRIMVTMPSEAATNPKLVQDLLISGMDVMRINCAHDGPQEWAAMVENLRLAEKAVGRSCRIQADLAGPKLRTGPISPAARVLKLKPRRDMRGRVVAAGKIWLTPSGAEESPPEKLPFILPLQGPLLSELKVDDVLQFKDTRDQKHELRIIDKQGHSGIAEILRTAYVEEGTVCSLIRDGKELCRASVQGLPDVVKPICVENDDVLILTRADMPGHAAIRDEEGTVLEPARIHCTLAEAFDYVESGQAVWFDDGKIGGVTIDNNGEEISVRITHTGLATAKLRAEKGINFPDTQFAMPALTNKDKHDLEAIVGLVDMVALSFLRGPEDVVQLQDHLYALGATRQGIVLKIENRQAFENLPRILLTSLRTPPVGVMIARGDLAVEVGFERLSEVQEEILWLCEAAHIPVIWATQILEGLAKKGSPSRAEVTDAAMSIQAECAMLNKGPNIIETVHFLEGIIFRMDDHFVKRRATLRRLMVADL
jgi:pyruvate kinase